METKTLCIGAVHSQLSQQLLSFAISDLRVDHMLNPLWLRGRYSLKSQQMAHSRKGINNHIIFALLVNHFELETHEASHSFSLNIRMQILSCEVG